MVHPAFLISIFPYTVLQSLKFVKYNKFRYMTDYGIDVVVDPPKADTE